jgi:hypothetical protein
MADHINLTDGPIRVTVTGAQPLDQAVEVSSYDLLDLLAGLLGVEGSTSGVGLRIITGMQRESQNGWVEYLAFTPGTLNAPNTWQALQGTTRLLRYIRWEVTGLGGATAVTFQINGMARSYGR